MLPVSLSCTGPAFALVVRHRKLHHNVSTYAHASQPSSRHRGQCVRPLQGPGGARGITGDRHGTFAPANSHIYKHAGRAGLSARRRVLSYMVRGSAGYRSVSYKTRSV